MNQAGHGMAHGMAHGTGHGMGHGMAQAAQGLDSTLHEVRAKFDAENSTAELLAQHAANTEQMARCVGVRGIRQRNRLRVLNEDIEAEIARRKRKAAMFDFITTEVHQALEMAQLEYQRQLRESRILQAARAEPIDEEAEARRQQQECRSDTAVLFQNLVLLDNGHQVQDARSVVDDVCPNCAALMNRNLRVSCLVCPTPTCRFMRHYIDTSSYSNSTYSLHNPPNKNTPNNVTHYSAFLNTSQGHTSSRLSREFLLKICYFLRVQGIKRRQDITKASINRAQKFFLSKNEYNKSSAAGTKLRGDALRFPPDVVKTMHLLFRAISPVFERFKRYLKSDRRNMTNFDFFSRVMVRLLGYDVFLDLFTKFRLRPNEIRHYAFMRRLFRKMKWEWSEELSDVPDAVLDQFDERNRELDALMDDEDWPEA